MTLFSIAGIYYYYDIERQLYEDMGIRAKVQAEEIALIPSLITAVENKDVPAINHLMMSISARSDASYMVIGDGKAIHLFHSIYADRVGKMLVGETTGMCWRAEAPPPSGWEVSAYRCAVRHRSSTGKATWSVSFLWGISPATSIT